MQSAPCSQSLFEEHALQRTPLPLGPLPPSTVDASDAPLELPDEEDEDDEDEGGGRGST